MPDIKPTPEIETPKRKPDILAFPKNKNGKDHICGDVHGKLALLKGLHASLPANDRLYLLGDLIDRGEDSLGVIEYIQANNKDPTKAKIFSIRGNHENILLNRVNYSLGHGKLKDHILHQTNGGEWVNSIENNHDIQTLKKIRDFADDLKYIFILIDETDIKKSVAMVHAAMPIGDNELLARLNKKTLDPHLSEAERKYATWAREAIYKTSIQIEKIFGRNASSMLAVAGHTVNGEIRREENTIVLDTASWLSNALMVLNVTDMKCSVYSPDPEFMQRTPAQQMLLNNIQRIQSEINAHINKNNQDRDISTLNEYVVIKDFRPIAPEPAVKAENLFQENLKNRLTELIRRYHADNVLATDESHKHLGLQPFFTELNNLTMLIENPQVVKLKPEEVLHNIIEHLENTLARAARSYFQDHQSKPGLFEHQNTPAEYVEHINKDKNDTYLKAVAVTIKEIYQLMNLDNDKFRQEWGGVIQNLKAAQDFGLEPLQPQSTPIPKP